MHDKYCCANCLRCECKDEGVCYCELQKDFVEENDICDDGEWDE